MKDRNYKINVINNYFYYTYSFVLFTILLTATAIADSDFEHFSKMAVFPIYLLYAPASGMLYLSIMSEIVNLGTFMMSRDKKLFQLTLIHTLITIMHFGFVFFSGLWLGALFAPFTAFFPEIVVEILSNPH